MCRDKTLIMSIAFFTAFLAVAGEDMGRQLPYAFLERVKDEFLRMYNDRGKIAPAHSLDKAFGCA